MKDAAMARCARLAGMPNSTLSAIALSCRGSPLSVRESLRRKTSKQAVRKGSKAAGQIIAGKHFEELCNWAHIKVFDTRRTGDGEEAEMEEEMEDEDEAMLDGDKPEEAPEDGNEESMEFDEEVDGGDMGGGAEETGGGGGGGFGLRVALGWVGAKTGWW